MPQQVVGPISYPDVRNISQGAAESLLNASYFSFQYGTSVYDSGVANGNIRTQSPDPDTTPTADPAITTVTLTVSLGVGGGRGRFFLNDFSFRF